MLQWKTTKSYKNDVCDSHQITYKEHVIRVCETERHTHYVLQWYRGATLEVQKPFDASSLDEAKAYALAAVKNYIAEKAMYWRDVKIGFANFTNEDA
ncbi:MAG: hypothetical protein IJZ68_08340 [Bacteroidaceae bacterium]|nr:hypothetical protein [Bacteroidaceae bacterium]